MSHAKMQHPTDETMEASYGWDRAIGFFVEVRKGPKCVAAYDATRGGYRDLQGALEVLAEHAFFDREDIEYAHSWMRVLMPDEIDEEGPRRAAQAIHALRRAADA